MTVVNMAARRCLCAEVCGENPDCALHGVETQWAIDNTMPTDWQNMVLEYREMQKKQADRIEALEARCERYREALEPSGDTKAAYMGEFAFTLTRTDECGDEYPEKVYVPWTTIKDIMAAIRKRAALEEAGNGRG